MAEGFALMEISAVGEMRYENVGTQSFESLLKEA
jgi:hypothetical protein